MSTVFIFPIQVASVDVVAITIEVIERGIFAGKRMFCVSILRPDRSKHGIWSGSGRRSAISAAHEIAKDLGGAPIRSFVGPLSIATPPATRRVVRS